MENSNKSLLNSFRRAFRPSSSRKDRVEGKSPVCKKKEIRVFPEELERRYEDISDFSVPLQQKQRQTSPRGKRSHKVNRSFVKPRQKTDAVLYPSQSVHSSPTHHSSKCATLPLSCSSVPAFHTIRIPPPRHTRRQPPPLPTHPEAIQRQFPPRVLPHTMSTIDFHSSQQHKAPVNISPTGPKSVPHDYSEPYHWLVSQDDPYSTVSPPCNRSWSNSSEKGDYANLQVSASMMDLRSPNEYMQINRSTMDRPTVASDYQQPIALKRLPGPPSAVRERQQRRREEKRLIRGTIIVLDEDKTLEV